jgi:hypothetical protein
MGRDKTQINEKKLSLAVMINSILINEFNQTHFCWEIHFAERRESTASGLALARLSVLSSWMPCVLLHRHSDPAHGKIQLLVDSIPVETTECLHATCTAA